MRMMRGTKGNATTQSNKQQAANNKQQARMDAWVGLRP